MKRTTEAKRRKRRRRRRDHHDGHCEDGQNRRGRRWGETRKGSSSPLAERWCACFLRWLRLHPESAVPCYGVFLSSWLSQHIQKTQERWRHWRRCAARAARRRRPTASSTTPTQEQCRRGDAQLLWVEGKRYSLPPCAHRASACPHRRRPLARHDRGRGREVEPSSQRRRRTTWEEHPEPADAPATPRCNPLQRLTKERPGASRMTMGWDLK